MLQQEQQQLKPHIFIPTTQARWLHSVENSCQLKPRQDNIVGLCATAVFVSRSCSSILSRQHVTTVSAGCWLEWWRRRGSITCKADIPFPMEIILVHFGSSRGSLNEVEERLLLFHKPTKPTEPANQESAVGNR